MNIPENLLYTEDHEWLLIEGGIATVGVTDFAQGELGDIVYVEIETEGDIIESGEVFGTVEAVKTVSDLFMPLTGEVVEVNAALEDEPEKVNNDTYGDGWMIKIKLSDPENRAGLLTAEAYKAVIGA
jgi:glycine cleavage system H protein